MQSFVLHISVFAFDIMLCLSVLQHSFDNDRAVETKTGLFFTLLSTHPHVIIITDTKYNTQNVVLFCLQQQLSCTVFSGYRLSGIRLCDTWVWWRWHRLFKSCFGLLSLHFLCFIALLALFLLFRISIL